MNRDEKNQQSKRKIIDSAMQEFGELGYGLSSINTICSAGKISKGNIYHHFKDKDALYLSCVEECFEHLTIYLKEHINTESESIEDGLKVYFSARLDFFEQYPLYQKLFCDVIISPPQHLANEIGKIKADFDTFNTETLTILLKKVNLRTNITVNEVVEMFRFLQDFANAHMQMEPSGSTSIKDMEQIRENLLHVLLYGVLEREDNNI